MSVQHIEEFRRFIEDYKTNDLPSMGIDIVEEFVDEIEAEVSEYFVGLPTDADGVPICQGDKLMLEHNGNVVTVRSLELVNGKWHIWPVEDGGPFTSETPCRHCKRNVEDVLQEFVDKLLAEGVLKEYARERMDYDTTDEMNERIEQLKRECVADIREVME